MNWKNVRYELPEEHRTILMRFVDNYLSKITYYVGKRDGNMLSLPGIGIWFISRSQDSYETYWVYKSEIDSDFEKSKKG